MSNKSTSHTYLYIFRHAADMPDPSPEQMQKIFQKWMNWMGTIKAKGQLLGGEPLEDSGKVLRGPRGSKLTDGPFAEAKEVVGGYLLITAKSYAEATKIAKRCPGLENGGTVEIRQIMPMHD
jgi:hypothetical protein